MLGAPPSGYERFLFESAGARPLAVFRRGAGPGVLILHELPGLSLETFELGNRIAVAGFRVYLPLLFGSAGQDAPLRAMLQLCISREWRLFASHASSPIVDRLRVLCRHIHCECGGPGVGAIGMCLTGNFAISLMLDDALLAPVLCQPGLPLWGGKAALGMSSMDLECAKHRARGGVGLLAFRFSGDSKCPAERFAALGNEFGDGIEQHELPGDQHSVLTYGFVDEVGHPTTVALQRTIEFLDSRLKAD